MLLSARLPVLSAAVLLSPMAPCALFGATRGAQETFDSMTNADSWSVLDSFDGLDYYPFWNSDPASGNPDIYFFFTEDAPIIFYAEAASSGGSFTGDYTAARILAIGCDFFIEDFDSFDVADIYFYSETDGRFYYSRDFDTASYFLGSGWDTIETAFLGAPWYFFDGSTYVRTDLTPDSLRSVSELGVRCFPRDATADAYIVAIDNVYLVPELIPPALGVDPGTTTSITGSFTLSPGQTHTLWQSDNLVDWVSLEAYRDLTGEGPVAYDVPVSPGTDTFLRVRTEEFYTPVPDLGP